MNLIFPYNANIDYNFRLKNPRSKSEKEVLYSRDLQIIQVDKYLSFTGKVKMITAKAKTVIEQ